MFDLRKKYSEIKSYWDYASKYSNQPHSGFILYGFGRSGTTLLTNLLNCHPDLFCDSEIFHENRVGHVLFPEHYLKGKARQKRSVGKKVYGAGIMSYQLRHQKRIDHFDFLKSLARSGWKIIHIRRRNILAIAISIIKAQQDTRWEIKDSGWEERSKIKISLDRLDHYLKTITFCHGEEDKILNEIDSFKVVYERDLEDGVWQPVMEKIFNYLELSAVEVGSELKRKSNRPLKEQIENYDEVKEKFDQFVMENNLLFDGKETLR